MLKSLRVRLSLLYLAGSLGLVGLLGAATFGLLTLYFQRSTDLALEYKMALEFHSRGFSLPANLVIAEQDWARGGSRPLSISILSILFGVSGEEGEEGFTPATSGYATEENDERYDGSLAPVFVIPAAGEESTLGMPIVNNPAAIAHARQAGSDLRTVWLDEDTRLRLLTCSTPDGQILQVGRLLGDQDRLLSQYLTGLVIIGGATSLVLALVSWSLAGRSIKPAQRAWDQQQQFISNASHELRTPLTILRGSADYALRSPSAEEREKSLHHIVDECDYMNHLVDDLLLLSRLDAHRLILQGELVPLPELLQETTLQMEKLASAKGVHLKLEESQGTVRGDRMRLRQVLLILLDNALRFTPSGGMIQLGARVHGRDVVISVLDSGVGIPPEYLPHLFERFYQVPGQPGEERGNGLGLSIAKALVEAHRGRISLSSQPGLGTTAQVVLPAA